MYICALCMPGAMEAQRVSYPLELELQMIDDFESSFGYWELNLGPQKAQICF